MALVKMVTVKTGERSYAQGELSAGETITLYGRQEGVDGWKFHTTKMWADTHELTVPKSWVKEIAD